MTISLLQIVVKLFEIIKDTQWAKGICKIKKDRGREKQSLRKRNGVECLKWTYGLFGENYIVATLTILYLTVLGIIIPSLISIGQF